MKQAKPAIESTLLASLKRHNPAKVRAYAADDDSRDIAVPTRRKKWGTVIAAIEALSWVRVEMLDKSGAVLGYVENAEPARELEELTPATSAKDAGELRLAERIVALVMRGQRDAMTFRDQEVTALLRAQGDVVRELGAAVGALGAVYREQVAATRESGDERAAAVAAAAAAASAGANQGELQQLLEAMPTLLQVLPLLRGMLSPGTTPPVLNGVKGS